MLTFIKTALRISTTAFDDEIYNLIESAYLDMRNAGIRIDPDDALIKTATVEYCKWKFGDNADKEAWEKMYNDSKAKLQIATGYTEWGEL